LETVYAATGGGCWYLSGEQRAPQPARVSQVGRLEESLVLTSEAANFAIRRSADAADVFHQLERKARLARTWGDGYGYLMVATGRAEVMIDPVMNLWDTAPLQTIVEEAGGRFCDWQGRPTVHSGDAVATNGLVADEVLALTRGR
jgi:fructose-1,6-bisphosphatase/inositol monophosphatase family enzyme